MCLHEDGYWNEYLNFERHFPITFTHQSPMMSYVSEGIFRRNEHSYYQAHGSGPKLLAYLIFLFYQLVHYLLYLPS